MYLAYLDESHNERFYWLGALIVPDVDVRPLTEALDAVMAEAMWAYGVPAGAELHGHDLFHAKGVWEPLAEMPRARIGVFADALEAIASFDVRVIVRGVDRVRLLERYRNPHHPHSVVLSHLLERIDLCAQNDLGGSTMLVIADEVDEADSHRRDLWRFQRYRTPGYRPRRLEYVVDTLYFAPSSASRLLQASDLVLYLYQRIRNRQAAGVIPGRADRANARLWERIEACVHHIHCWVP